MPPRKKKTEEEEAVKPTRNQRRKGKQEERAPEPKLPEKELPEPEAPIAPKDDEPKLPTEEEVKSPVKEEEEVKPPVEEKPETPTKRGHNKGHRKPHQKRSRMTRTKHSKHEVSRQVKRKNREDLGEFKAIYESHKEETHTAALVNGMRRFVEQAYGDKSSDGKTVAAANYSLFKAISTVMTEPNYAIFKANFDVINKTFLLEKDGLFNPISLSRFDYYWTYGSDNKVKYQTIVELIHSLANPATRTEAKKRFGSESITNALPTAGVQNVVRYYSL